MISICLAVKPKKISIIQVCAPTSIHSDEEIESFCLELSLVMESSPKKDMTIIQGDWNAMVRPDAHKDWAGTAGKFGLGVTVDMGFRLLKFARYHNLVLANMQRLHKPSRPVTWHSLNAVDHNQIDYILVHRRYASGINTTKTQNFHVRISGATMILS